MDGLVFTVVGKELREGRRERGGDKRAGRRKRGERTSQSSIEHSVYMKNVYLS